MIAENSDGIKLRTAITCRGHTISSGQWQCVQCCSAQGEQGNITSHGLLDCVRRQPTYRSMIPLVSVTITLQAIQGERNGNAGCCRIGMYWRQPTFPCMIPLVSVTITRQAIQDERNGIGIILLSLYVYTHEYTVCRGIQSLLNWRSVGRCVELHTSVDVAWTGSRSPDCLEEWAFCKMWNIYTYVHLACIFLNIRRVSWWTICISSQEQVIRNVDKFVSRTKHEIKNGKDHSCVVSHKTCPSLERLLPFYSCQPRGASFASDTTLQWSTIAPGWRC